MAQASAHRRPAQGAAPRHLLVLLAALTLSAPCAAALGAPLQRALPARPAPSSAPALHGAQGHAQLRRRGLCFAAADAEEELDVFPAWDANKFWREWWPVMAVPAAASFGFGALFFKVMSDIPVVTAAAGAYCGHGLMEEILNIDSWQPFMTPLKNSVPDLGWSAGPVLASMAFRNKPFAIAATAAMAVRWARSAS